MNLILILILLIVLSSCSSTVRFSSDNKYNSSTNENKFYFNSNSPSDLRNKIISEAKQWIGTPYKYGGENKNGADCSGFVMAVYQNSGICLPRTSPRRYICWK